jgi:hypothetical protein
MFMWFALGKNKNISTLHKMSSTDDLIDNFATLFANYYECSKPLAKSAYLVARTNPVNNALSMQSRAQEIKSRIGLLIYYYKMYIIAKRMSPELTNTQRDDIMRHINKVINDSPLENTSDQTLQKLLELPTPQTGGKKGGRKWSMKYKRSINCNTPRGFSQRQYCKYGRRKTAKK